MLAWYLKKIKNIALIFSSKENNRHFFEKKYQKYLVNKKKPITFASALEQVLQGCEKKVKKYQNKFGKLK